MALGHMQFPRQFDHDLKTLDRPKTLNLKQFEKTNL